MVHVALVASLKLSLRAVHQAGALDAPEDIKDVRHGVLIVLVMVLL